MCRCIFSASFAAGIYQNIYFWSKYTYTKNEEREFMFLFANTFLPRVVACRPRTLPLGRRSKKLPGTQQLRILNILFLCSCCFCYVLPTNLFISSARKKQHKQTQTTTTTRTASDLRLSLREQATTTTSKMRRNGHTHTYKHMRYYVSSTRCAVGGWVVWVACLLASLGIQKF